MGQLQTAQIELEALCAQLAPVFLEYLRTHGTAIDRIEEVATLDGVTSMPVRYSLGGVEKNVLAPIKLLRAGVDEAIGSCGEAAADARAAAAEANSAVAGIESAMEGIAKERAETVAATAAANSAAARAEAATSDLDALKTEISAAEAGRVEAEAARVTAEDERVRAEIIRAAAEKQRISNESERKKNESARVLAETERKDTYERHLSEVADATKDAAEAAQLCRDVTEQIQGTAGYVPQELEVVAPESITFGNDHKFAVAARILPEEAAQNILFIGDDGAVSVAPDGSITVNRTGESVVHIIPVARVELYKTIRIRVTEPAMSLTAGGDIRLSGSGNIMLR